MYAYACGGVGALDVLVARGVAAAKNSHIIVVQLNAACDKLVDIWRHNFFKRWIAVIADILGEGRAGRSVGR